MKTVQRFFTVSGVLIAVFCLLAAVTPLSFAVNVDSNVYSMPIDNSFPYLYNYFFGTNSGIIDFKYNNNWYRVCLNNNFAYADIYKETVSYQTHYILVFRTHHTETIGKAWYWTNIGSSYSSGSSFSSSSWYDTVSATYDLGTGKPLINSCGVPLETDQLSSSDTQYCDFNSYYPLVASSGGSSSDNRIGQIINNQASESSAAQSRYEANQSADNSRQSEIINAGSDVTVSTIDNWVNGQNGLAGKLTELAATLSSNAAIFSQNQVSNQENLSRAGTFVNGVFSELPTGIIAACICFLIILICVKVVGR